MVFFKYFKFKTSKMVGFREENGIINIDKSYKIFVNKDKNLTNKLSPVTPVDVIFAEIYSSNGSDYYILEETDINKVMDMITPK